jgi:cytochrome c-type biogenesis protein CcmH
VNRKALCTLAWLALATAPVSIARAQRGIVPPPPPAGDSALEARTTAVASQLRCPVCQGLSLQESPSELAQQMRSVVRDQLSAGKSPDEIRAYFVSKYGEWILLEPRPVGFNVLVYALPAVVVVGGLVLIVVVVRRWTRQPEASG